MYVLPPDEVAPSQQLTPTFPPQHHEFPQDFRNAIKWYQYDPTKWLIFFAYKLGLASQLKVFPDNEIKKGQFAMSLKKLQRAAKDQIVWPTSSNDLPVLSWDECASPFPHQGLRC